MVSQHHQIISTGKLVSSLGRTFKKRKKERERMKKKRGEEGRGGEERKLKTHDLLVQLGHFLYIFMEALSNQYVEECDAQFCFSLIFFVTKLFPLSFCYVFEKKPPILPASLPQIKPTSTPNSQILRVFLQLWWTSLSVLG